MHSNAIDYLWRIVQSDLDTISKLFLIVIALHQQLSNDQWLGDNQAAELTSCSRRSIIRHRSTLEGEGWFITIRDEHNQLGYMLDAGDTESQLNNDQVTQSHNPCDIESQPCNSCDIESLNFFSVSDAEPQPGDTVSHPIKHPHPVEYAGDFDYLSELSLYWHGQCYTPARPASSSIKDDFKQEAFKEAARSETTDLQNGTRVRGDERLNKFGSSLVDDVTWLADMFSQYNIECGDRNIPAQVNATQRPFDDLDTWQTFIEDKLLDFATRKTQSGSQLILRALREDGAGWLAKRKTLATPANVISLNQHKTTPPKYPEQRIPVEPEFKLGGRYHRFKDDLPERELTPEEELLTKYFMRGSNR